MIPGLKAGKFDVIMDGMSITDDRQKEIDFTKPYAASPGSFLAPKDSPLAKATGAGTVINLERTRPPAMRRSSRSRRRSRARRSACRSRPPTPISPAGISRTSPPSRNTRPSTTATTTSSPVASTPCSTIFRPRWRPPRSLTAQGSLLSAPNSSATCSASARRWASASRIRT